MSATLGNGTITFGDGTVQTIATPANVSAFTNDSGYLTPSNVAATYATKAQSVGSFTGSWGYGLTLYLTNIQGTNIWGGAANCNCNC